MDTIRKALKYIDIVFDGPPDHESGRFVEVEDDTGKSISFGDWVQRPDGYWALRISSVRHSADCKHTDCGCCAGECRTA